MQNSTDNNLIFIKMVIDNMTTNKIAVYIISDFVCAIDSKSGHFC